MAFEEKITWMSGVVTLIAAGWYAWVVVDLFGQGPVEQIAYQQPLLYAVGAMLLFTILGSIAVAIGTASSAEITGEGSADDVDRTDERDADIGARGDRVSFYVVAALMVGVLAMAMLEVAHFWIANGVFGALVVAGLVGSGVKLAAYRRGF